MNKIFYYLRGIDSSNEIIDDLKNNKVELLISDCTSKKTKLEEKDNNLMSNNTFNLNFPLPNTNSNIACLVKTYDDFDNFKINGIYEFVGILSQDPALAYTYDEHGDALYEHNINNEQEKLIEQFKIDLNNEGNSMETEESKNNGTDSKKVLSSFVSI